MCPFDARIACPDWKRRANTLTNSGFVKGVETLILLEENEGKTFGKSEGLSKTARSA
jgi:hypothetical protein